jgi:CHAT domain-containing protein
LKYQNDALVISEKSRARAFADLLEKRLSSSLEISQTKPPSLEIIQKIAQEKKATLVEYYLAESRLYIWVVKPSGTIDLRQVDLPKTLNNSLESLVITTRQSLGVRGRRSSIVAELIVDTEEQKTKLQQLNQILIAPIVDLLPKDANAPVIFIPQGELFLVPFAALQDAQGKYLIQKHTILTAPSIQILDLTQQQRQQTNPQELVIVGNPTMPQISPIITEKLSPLPGAEKEAVAIAQLLETSPLIGNAATKTAILAKLPQARIVHFATHGLLDDFQGLGIPGAIALAPDGNDSGLLTAQEIFGLQLQAELVVLSACDTGRGRITGDGVIGLSRSLISAGVPSVIVSLWAIPDAPTASLMTEFYRNWQGKKLDKAQALRQAMLTTMKTHPEPRNWAAFTLIGEAD